MIAPQHIPPTRLESSICDCRHRMRALLDAATKNPVSRHQLRRLYAAAEVNCPHPVPLPQERELTSTAPGGCGIDGACIRQPSSLLWCELGLHFASNGSRQVHLELQRTAHIPLVIRPARDAGPGG